MHGTAELWMAHTTPGCIGSPVHQRCWSISCHLVVSWGFWNLETWQSSEIDAMTPCLFVLGPRGSPRWRTQVAIILLAILNDDVMVMGILYPGRLEVCCAENCLSYRDRRLKKKNVFNKWQHHNITRWFCTQLHAQETEGSGLSCNQVLACCRIFWSQIPRN